MTTGMPSGNALKCLSRCALASACIITKARHQGERYKPWHSLLAWSEKLCKIVLVICTYGDLYIYQLVSSGSSRHLAITGGSWHASHLQ